MIFQPVLAATIQFHNRECMNFLLEAGGNPNVIYSSGSSGLALNEAIEQDLIEAVKALVAKGAEVNLAAGTYGTPLLTLFARVMKIFTGFSWTMV